MVDEPAELLTVYIVSRSTFNLLYVAHDAAFQHTHYI
jgi:hypothetical protein